MTYSPLSESQQISILTVVTITKKIGERIRQIRTKRGLSQEALAHIAELDRTYINSIENGKRNVGIENIEKIATALNVALKDFFDHELFR